MNEIIFTGFGVDIIKRDGEYFIRYDTGTIAMIEKESKITPEEALKAQKSENDAYEVIIATQTRERENKHFFS
ncbi:hypothetical protein [Enterobacter chengduensis]|uniref:hypothetical protein n=1 Tax=Enterobacter chengduensis TaxID=2494701 RepID=UPI002002A14E|nr:hypothetical protein [Enterobacter chengduensis]MCK7427710.1 hypothetical protein [Enterobacter chengduensis]